MLRPTDATAGAESHGGTFRSFLTERVVYGQDAANAVAAEAFALGKERVFLTTSRSLSGPDALPAAIAGRLGDRWVGTFDAVEAHSPRHCVLAGAAAAREAGADLIVAVGGGSVMDATKVMLLCLWEELRTDEELDRFRGRLSDPSRLPDGGERQIRMLAVPTMFAAAEFTCVAGITDPGRQVKEGFHDPLFASQVVVLDPAATEPTPLPLLWGTGMKAIDHAVEWSCATVSTPLVDAVAGEALSLLLASLPKLGTTDDGRRVRMDCQFGMWLSIFSAGSGVPVGASHAIGHVLGAYGVPHGHTTGVVLPAVLRWNQSGNAAKQARVAEFFGVNVEQLPDTVAGLAQRFGLPTRLRDLALTHDQLGEIADKTMLDRAIRTNPRPVTGTDDVREILDHAW